LSSAPEEIVREYNAPTAMREGAPYADTLEARYRTVREAMSDSEIAAVAAVLKNMEVAK
jgi:hypothetical protein